MPVFHFDVTRDGRTEIDDIGIELSSIYDARTEGISLVPVLLKESQESEACGMRELIVTVRDGHPEPLVVIRVSVKVEDRA